MPYIGSSEVDVAGVLMLREWIAALPSETVTAGSGRSLPEDRADVSTKALGEAGLAELLTTTSGALRLLDAIDSGALSQAENDRAIELAARHADVQVRDLF